MIPYIGDFAEDATVYHYFNTFSSNDPSASITITDLADTDIYVYKDGSVTDLVTDGASVVIDFDSRTGVHKLTIDTSAHADYAIGSDYMVLIEGTTVDAGTITAAMFTFSIENRYNDVNVVTVSGTAQTANDNGADINAILLDTAVIGALGAGLTNIPWNSSWDAEVQSECTDALNAYDPATHTELIAEIDAVQVDVAAVKAETALILTDTGTTLQAELDAIQAAVITNAAGVDIAADIIAVKAETALIVEDTGTTIPATLTTIDNEIATIDTVVDGIQTDLDNATDGLGAIKAETALIVADTNELQTDDIPGTIAALNNISTAEVATELATYDGPTNTEMVAAFTEIKGATWATTDSLEAIRDRGDAAWTTGAGGTPPQLLQDTTIATLASQTSFTLTAGSADDDAYNDQICVIEDAATSEQKAVGIISDYTGSSKTVTLSADPAVFTMAATDKIKIIASAAAGTAPTAAANAIAVWDALQSAHTTVGSFGEVATEVASILVDTGTTIPGTITTIDNELATVDANVDLILTDTGTTLQAELDAIQAAVITNAAGVDIAADIIAMKAETALIVADTNELQTDDVPTLISNLDAVVDTVKAETALIVADTNELQTDDVPGLIAALNDISTADVNAQVVDVIRTDTVAELAGVPAATSTLADKINWLFMLARNQIEQTATTSTLRADDTTTAVATATVSDDATTAQRDEWA